MAKMVTTITVFASYFAALFIVAQQFSYYALVAFKDWMFSLKLNIYFTV